PFGAIIYGFADFDAYSYPAGLSVDSVPNATISLLPANQSQQVGTQHCAVATVAGSNGNPLGGIRIGFGSSGANLAQGSQLSDFAGIAEFCYTGAAAGSDSLTASAGNITAGASTTWVAAIGNQAPYVNAGPSQSVLLPQNQPLTLGGVATDDGL